MTRTRTLLLGLGGAAFAFVLGGAAWVHSLGPPPLGRDLDTSHVVQDREGRLLRAYAAGPGVWRLRAEADGVDPRFLSLLIGYEDKRFHDHLGVDPLAMGTRGISACQPRSYRLRRKYFVNAGRAAAGAAARAQLRRPSCARSRARWRSSIT